MPPDLTKLFLEERARRRAAASASTSTVVASTETYLESLESRPAVNLSDFDVGKNATRPVSGLYHIPEFITESEEQALLAAIRSPQNNSRWTTATDGGRRIANWGGKPSDVTVTEPLPPWASTIVDALFSRNVFCDDKNKKHVKPNHVLVNEYQVPSGIAPHNDGDVYAPCVAILTLEGDALIDFWENDGSEAIAVASDDDDDDDDKNEKPVPRAQVMLRCRSLLVYENDAYRLRHGIRETRIDFITDKCVNCETTNVSINEKVERGKTRVSIVFVIKRNKA